MRCKAQALREQRYGERQRYPCTLAHGTRCKATFGHGKHADTYRQGVHHRQAPGHLYQERDNDILLAKGAFLPAQRPLSHGRFQVRQGYGHLYLSGRANIGHQRDRLRQGGPQGQALQERAGLQGLSRMASMYRKQERTLHRALHLSGGPGGKPKKDGGKPGILQAQATDNRTPVRDHQKTMGLHPYIDERKIERALRGKPDHDMLQP